MQNKLGVCQWFHYEAYEDLERAVNLLRNLGVRHLRTGISWADYHRPNGKRWYDHQMNALREFDVLLSIWHTPPSRAEGGTCASPPARLEDFADFVEQVIDEYGSTFSHLELWNEPNNRIKWDFQRFDPDWTKFGHMIRAAARRTYRRNVPSVLGGMIPVDHHWLNLIRGYGALEFIDIVAIHGFPGMWWSDAPNWDWYSHWRGWTDKVSYIARHTEGRPIWITETGLATWSLERHQEDYLDLQSRCLRAAADAPAERVYWYSLEDLDPKRSAIEGFHVDENEYHMGLVRYQGRPKPAFATAQGLVTQAADTAASAHRSKSRSPTTSPSSRSRTVDG